VGTAAASLVLVVGIAAGIWTTASQDGHRPRKILVGLAVVTLAVGT
jgi:hypothetical protein